MQTSVMLYNNKGNIAGAAVDCDSAPLQMRPVCFSSLGRDISSYSQQQHREAIRLCSLANPKYQPFCYNGVVKNFIDLEARPQDGLAFCRDVPGEINKAVCYNAVGEQLVPLRPEPGERRSVCAASEDGYIEACLYGARIPGARAPGMLQKFWASLRS